ncbi:hypothetical protein GX51_07887 [Blastomyces parvus]|uniref:Trafficking protein particle complex subunit n=1 Tax=Blastomyces parvus TaxID=2060905 RepID=A0A2B7W9U9_9EURO|nr:hypothetical protein GX51_07887 [Blastomyces parvus]
MSTPANLNNDTNNNDNDDARKSQRKSSDHTLRRVRNNQRRCRERRRQYIAALEQKVEETERLLNEAHAEIAKLKSELMQCSSHRPLHPERDNQLAAEGGGSSIDDAAAAWMIPSGEMGGYRHVSGHNQEQRELLDLLPSSVPAGVDDWVAPTLHDQTADIGHSNIMADPPPFQQVDILLPKQLSSPSPALATKPCEGPACGSNALDAITADVGASTSPPTASFSLSTISTPTLTALHLQDLIPPNFPASLLSSNIYTFSPADESTTPCTQAFVFISQQNFKGVDASVIERWLSRGFRKATDPTEGCRVENNLLFQLLDFISGPFSPGFVVSKMLHLACACCFWGSPPKIPYHRGGSHGRSRIFYSRYWAPVECSGSFLFADAWLPAVYSLIIINKAGGLIYNREFQSGLLKLSTNDYLVLAGTFHGIHAITRSLTPRLPANLTTTPSASASASTASTGTTIPSHAHALSSSSSIRSPLYPPTSAGSSSLPPTTSASASTASPLPANTTVPNPTQPITGLEVLETDKFRLTCFQTVTGTKFLLFTDPLMTGVEAVMRRIYELYADYVMKNPFYQLEMPVRCDAFDRHVAGWVKGRG